MTARRAILLAALVAVAGVNVAASALAQTYPMRPVRIIVGFTAGGGTDDVARLIGQWLSEKLGQPFIIENRTGAASNIATEAVINSRPDGYTLLMAGGVNAVNDTLYANLNFSFVRDIAPVASVMRIPQIIDVNRSLPVKSLPEFIAYVKGSETSSSPGGSRQIPVVHLQWCPVRIRIA